ncbi:MAG: GNAT family N-acetyltransferase [Caldilineaceae bacterium]
MTILAVGDGFVIRKVKPADLDQLAAWIHRDSALDFFDRRDTREALKNYFDGRDREICCIVEYGGRAIGYVEFYPSRLRAYVYGDSPDERPWGIDVFLGSPADRNQGLGSRMIKVVAMHLFQERRATRIVIDPEASNERAIRCYEKVGFKKSKFIPASVTAEGAFNDTWLMEMSPPNTSGL